ncbi:TIGR03086 family metal-binding protein [Amycolatopsis pigmentata]|uniref:TIGR03086 family metal-binding protein n=1 Tax=Amycolatopsis pigmentata TaxID=450801 RepID=A0ABW5G3L2_9PSEU
MDLMDSYRRAQDGLDTVLAAVRPGQWDTVSACPEWTVRDVAGHLVWAQHQVRAWAAGEEYTERAGAPGAPHPGVLAGEDPLGTWRSARAASVSSLTDETLARTVVLPGMGEVPLRALLPLMLTDQLVHTWDIGHPLGLDVRLDPALVPMAFDWARTHALRRPGFFGPELPVEDERADEQARMLAFLGRSSAA